MNAMERLALRLTADGVPEVHRVVFLRALEAGLALEDMVIVPRKATPEMCMAHGNPAYPAGDIWDAMITEATKP